MEKTSEIPFVVRTTKQGEDDKYIITVGKYQAVNTIFNTKEEAEEYLNKVEDTIPTGIWELIAALSMAMTDWVLKQIHYQKQNEEDKT